MAYDRLFGFDTTQKATLTKWLKEELAAAGLGGSIGIRDVEGLGQTLSDISQALDALEARVEALENP